MHHRTNNRSHSKEMRTIHDDDYVQIREFFQFSLFKLKNVVF